MSTRWETDRGDEWWYTSYWCEIEASLSLVYPAILAIEKLRFKAGQLSSSRVHQLLWSTQQQFSECEIKICDYLDMLPFLKDLQGKGHLDLKLAASTYSKWVEILRFSPPAPQPLI